VKSAEKPQILCIGHDPVLNRTRRLILEKHFEVSLAHGPEESVALLGKRRFALILLCYSLTDDECRAVVEILHGVAPDTRILALGEVRERLGLSAPDEVFVSGGPAELLKKCVSIVGMNAAPENRAIAAEMPRDARPPAGTRLEPE